MGRNCRKQDWWLRLKKLSKGDNRNATEQGIRSVESDDSGAPKKHKKVIKPMKTRFLLIPACIAMLSLVSCEDKQTTTVSKSLWGDDTIVSRSSSNGGYTRTEYGTDFFGNQTVTTTRGHSNATEQGDLATFLLEAAAALFVEFNK